MIFEKCGIILGEGCLGKVPVAHFGSERAMQRGMMR